MSGESGKVDILLTKEAAGVQWTELGQGLQGNNSFKPHKERGIKNSENAQIYLLYARIFTSYLKAWIFQQRIFFVGRKAKFKWRCWYFSSPYGANYVEP